MRKTLLLFTLFVMAGSLWAADPIIGTWKEKSAKSKGTELPPNPEFAEVMVTYREIGKDRIEMTYTVTRADGTSRTDIGTYPALGGAVEWRPEDLEEQEGVSGFQMLAGPGEWYAIYIRDGKQIATRHKVVARDGKKIHETMKALADPMFGGKPFEVELVYEKQTPKSSTKSPAK